MGFYYSNGSYDLTLDKRGIMKLIAILILLISTQASAETWVTYAYTAKSNRDLDFDAASITHYDNRGTTLIVWHRIIHNRDLLRLARTEFHCASRSYRTVSEARFDDVGEVIFQKANDSEPWQYTVPTTPEYLLLDTVCRNYH